MTPVLRSPRGTSSARLEYCRSPTPKHTFGPNVPQKAGWPKPCTPSGTFARSASARSRACLSASSLTMHVLTDADRRCRLGHVFTLMAFICVTGRSGGTNAPRSRATSGRHKDSRRTARPVLLDMRRCCASWVVRQNSARRTRRIASSCKISFVFHIQHTHGHRHAPRSHPFSLHCQRRTFCIDISLVFGQQQ